MCIAVLHHISSSARRVRLLRELARVLRPGGRALVTVWASQQEEPGKLDKWQPIPCGLLPRAPPSADASVSVMAWAGQARS